MIHFFSPTSIARIRMSTDIILFLTALNNETYAYHLQLQLNWLKVILVY